MSYDRIAAGTAWMATINEALRRVESINREVGSTDPATWSPLQKLSVMGSRNRVIFVAVDGPCSTQGLDAKTVTISMLASLCSDMQCLDGEDAMQDADTLNKALEIIQRRCPNRDDTPTAMPNEPGA